jgi:membrane associated rhomboid family serine protease
MLPLKDSESSGGFPFWTVVIIALNIFFFYLEVTSPNPEAFIAHYALIPSLVDFSTWQGILPFITSQFLHGGFLHIASNMLFLWIFGDNVEDRMGFLFFPIFYVLAGIIGGLTQYFIDPTSGVPTIGASGAIAGVLGAYFALFPHNKIKSLVFFFGFITIINIPAWLVLIYWFITQVFSGTFSIAPSQIDQGGIAYFAHIGGFVTGWIIAQFFHQTNKKVIEGVLVTD